MASPNEVWGEILNIDSQESSYQNRRHVLRKLKSQFKRDVSLLCFDVTGWVTCSMAWMRTLQWGTLSSAASSRWRQLVMPSLSSPLTLIRYIYTLINWLWTLQDRCCVFLCFELRMMTCLCCFSGTQVDYRLEPEHREEARTLEACVWSIGWLQKKVTTYKVMCIKSIFLKRSRNTTTQYWRFRNLCMIYVHFMHMYMFLCYPLSKSCLYKRGLQQCIHSFHSEPAAKVMVELLGSYTEDNASQARVDAHR